MSVLSGNRNILIFLVLGTRRTGLCTTLTFNGNISNHTSSNEQLILPPTSYPIGRLLFSGYYSSASTTEVFTFSPFIFSPMISTGSSCRRGKKRKPYDTTHESRCFLSEETTVLPNGKSSCDLKCQPDFVL